MVSCNPLCNYWIYLVAAVRFRRWPQADLSCSRWTRGHVRYAILRNLNSFKCFFRNSPTYSFRSSLSRLVYRGDTIRISLRTIGRELIWKLQSIRCQGEHRRCCLLWHVQQSLIVIQPQIMIGHRHLVERDFLRVLEKAIWPPDRVKPLDVENSIFLAHVFR